MKLIKLISFGIMCMLLFSCKTTIKNQDLNFHNGLYYNKKTNSLINGEISLIDEKNGLKSILNFNNGVPEGKWIQYGFDNEIIQEGNIIPIILEDKEDVLLENNILRLNLNYFFENKLENYIVNIIYVKHNPSLLDSILSQTNLDSILKIINHKKIIPNDVEIEIRLLKGELEGIDKSIKIINKN